MSVLFDLFSPLSEEEEYYMSLYEAEGEDVSAVRLPSPVEEKAREKTRITLSSSFYLKSGRDSVRVLKHPVFMPRYLHSHDFVEIAYAFKGSAEERVEGKDLTLSEGELLVLTPGVYHTVSVREKSAIMVNIIAGSSLFYETEEKLGGRLRDKRYSKLSLSLSLEEELSHLLEEQEKDDEMSREISRALFLLLLAKIERNSKTVESGEKEGVYRALSYIDKNYRSVTLESLSNALNMSPRSASRLFKEQFGSSFTDIVKKKRMEEALYLLEHSDLSCKEIGYLVGYESQEHFSRLFHSYYGVSAKSVKKRRLSQ